MIPEINIGPITLYTFGIMSVLGFWIGGFVMGRFLVQLGKPREWAWEMILVAMIGGVIGASIDWAIQNNGSLADTAQNILSGGGLVWFGGMMGGMTAFILWSIWRKNLGWEIVAVSSFGFILVQLFGRIGCQLAGDGDYGIPWDGPWAMGYPNGTVPTPPGVEVHPTPIYEALGLAILASLLWSLRWKLTPTQSIAMWFFGVFLIRFPVEFIRTNPEVYLGLTTAQITSVALLLVATVIVWIPSSWSATPEKV